ncbi:MAG: Gfo/Idh/MocA family protein [Verrucomicrobiales bacterium]|nr:Gfo/Idh/MocA family oxidoreductase [Verrucomicrobiota bacterium JB025]
MRIGIVGMGFMGGTHLKAWRKVEQATVAAVCDSNPDFGKGKKGNIGSGSDELDLDGVAIHSDLAEMLASENLDAVSIALPTHLHKVVAVQCLEAGVHVLCEKPMALNGDDCDAMIAAATAAGKQLMVAHCIRFWPEYVWLKESADAGSFGRIVAAEFERLSAAPAWSGDSWFADPAKSGGIALDLHVHDLDFINYLLGKPAKVESRKVPMASGMTGHVQTWLSYPDNLTVSATASWLMPQSFPFRMAFKAVFEKAAVVFEGGKLTVYPGEGEPFTPELQDGDGYQNEVAHFAELISGRADKPVITPEQAAESVRMALETEYS